jgi:hypothetical protein
MAPVATSGDYPLLPLFAEKAGLDLAKVTRIRDDNKVRAGCCRGYGRRDLGLCQQRHA